MYQIVYVNVTTIEKSIVNENVIQRRYEIVCVNATSKRGRDMKLFVKMLHIIEDRRRYEIVYVNVTHRRQAEI
jgi:hypothetical protein